MSDRDEMRQMAITVGLWVLTAVLVAGLIAVLAGCSFNLLPNGLWGPQAQSNGVPRETDKPPPVQPPSGQGNKPSEDSTAGGQWQWLSDPALWSSVAFGVVYVGNQVRKSRKYGRGQ